MSSHRGSKQRIRGPSASLSGKSGAVEMERLRKSEVDSKAKVKTLETEVSTLKARLDGLRKAKNTTIIRREREEIRIYPTHFGQHQSPQSSFSSVDSGQSSEVAQCSHHSSLEQVKELESQVDTLKTELLSEKSRFKEECESAKASHLSELTSVREQHRQEVKRLQSEVEELKKNRNQVVEDERGHALQALQAEVKWLREENSNLSSRLEEVLASNEALSAGSKLLQQKSEALLEELSVKEAEWSQREDRLNAEIRKQWGDRYHEWMTKAERKMEELQQINTLLQSMLKTKQDNDL